MRGELARSVFRATVLALAVVAVVLGDLSAHASSYTIVPGGSPVTVTTTTAGENARATFSGTAGSSISLRITGVTIASALVSIQKPDGTNLVAASSFGTSGKFIDRKQLPVNGTYTILIDPQGTRIGSATLTLYDVPPDVTGSITPGGAPLTLTTTVPGQNARASFAGTAGQRVAVKVGPTCCSLNVSIQKPDGTNLVAATAVGASGGFIDTKTLPVNGTYTIVVNPQSFAVGATTLTLYDVPPDVSVSIAPDGTPVTVTTTGAGQNAKLTFAGTAGDRISLKVGPTCCSLSVSIQKPGGTNLFAPVVIGASGGFVDTKTLPVNGTYTILVSPQAEATGSVTVTLYDVPADALASITPGGAPVTLTTTVPGQNAKATFTGVNGRGVALKLDGVTMGTSATSSLQLSIVKPDGTNLVAPTLFGRSGGFIDTKNLPANGTYSIVVNPQADATGSVTLTLYDVPPQLTGTITPGGAPVSLNFAAPYQNGRVTFAGTAGQRISMRINFAPTACCTVNVSINRPNGTRLVAPIAVSGSGDGLVDGTTLPSTGTYVIVVDPQQTATGTVTLTLFNLPPDVTASATLDGPPVTVTTTASGQDARVTFSGVVGDGVVVKLGPGNCCNISVSVLRPTGTTLIGPVPFGTAGGSLFVQLPVSGTYTIVIDYFGASIGAVTVQVSRDNAGPSGPTLTLAATTSDGFAQGTQFFYRPAGAGGLTVTATTSDPGSGIDRVAFPGTGGGFTPVAGVTDFTSPYLVTYTWTAGATFSNGSNTVTAFDNVGNSSTATFSVLPDSTPPTTTDNTAAIGNAWKNTNQTVTLTPTDGSGSGVAATYYTTNGTNPTTASPSGTAISLTSDGVYTIKYFSVDNVTNAEAVKTAGTQIRIDKTIPSTATLTALPAAIRNGQVLTASAADALSGVASVSYRYCSGAGCTPATVIGSSTTGPTYSVTWNSQPADGVYRVMARVTDVAGNIRDSAIQTVTVDNTNPLAPTITASPPNPSNSAAPSFSFTGEPGATFQCQLDGGGFSACTSPKPYSGLTAGSHTFQVRQTDTAGNQGPAASYTWTIDLTAPAAPSITANPQALSNSRSATFSFTGEAGATFECQLDGGAFGACTSPKPYTLLADGSHTFNVRQRDAAGNASPNASYTWTIDATSPAAPNIMGQPANPTNATSASFAFTGEAGATFECQLDGGGFSACTSPKPYSGLSAGSHTFQVHQTDTAGNTGPNASYTWTIDLTAPAAPNITSNPADPTNSTSASFSFTGDAGATFQCQLDGGGFTACTSPENYGGPLGPGSHTFNVRQTDTAGNTGPNASYTWTIDTSAPETTIDNSPTDPSTADVSFDFSSSEGGSSFECNLDVGGFTPCSSPEAYTGLAPGPHTFEVRATDAAGNTDATSATFAWNVA
jgi:Chitobiase/beta-hexosaminidase C-terminal domain/Bacterial Ig-like domain